MKIKIANDLEYWHTYAVTAKIPEFSAENTNGAILCCIAPNPRAAKMKLYKALCFYGVDFTYLDLRAVQMTPQQLQAYREARDSLAWDGGSNYAAWLEHNLTLYHPVKTEEKAAV